MRVGEAPLARVEQELGGRRAEQRAEAREREQAAVRRRPELRARIGRAFAEAAVRAVSSTPPPPPRLPFFVAIFTSLKSPQFHLRASSVR